MKRLVIFLCLYALQVSDADFNASRDSCVPASSPVSSKQINKACHPYISKEQGYCRNNIGDWLVKPSSDEQKIYEAELRRVRISILMIKKIYNINITKACLLTFNDVYCRWRFPKCDTITANLTEAICKESCEYVFKMCAGELKLMKELMDKDKFMNCMVMKPSNGGERPECYHSRFSNTETDKLRAAECYYGNGLGYRGNVSVTTSGHVCQSWASQCPHRHDHPLSEYPELVNASNWCRNPGGQGPHGPWCYTTNSSIRWKYCDVEKCPPPVPSLSPTILQVSSRGPKRVFLAWRSVPLPFVHGQLRGFRISVIKLNARHEKQIVNTTSPSVTSIELNDLEPLTNYSLSVLAFNENGDGPSSRAVSVETMPENSISVKFILTLNQQKFSDHLLDKQSMMYQKLASRVMKTISTILKETKTTEYRIYHIEISRFINGSVLSVEFYVTAEVLGFLPKWSIVQDITGRIVKRYSSRRNKSAGRMNFRSLLVKDTPPPPPNVSGDEVTMTSVRVYWSPPLYHEPYRITNYTVQYKKAKTEMSYYDAVSVNANKTKVNVDHLDLDTKYLMRVVSVNAYGPSTASQPIIVKTKASKSASNTVLIIVLSVAAAVIGVTLIIIGVAWRRWSNKREYLTQLNSTNLFEALGIEITKAWWEIPRDDLSIEEEIGSGSFGVVMRAYLNTGNEKNEKTLCAVKMLKDNPTERELRDLCNEINLMTVVGDHPNIISLIGACTADGPPWLVVKCAVNGCLLDYLRENRKTPIYSNLEKLDNTKTIAPELKLSFAYDIAKGMSHFEKNRVVHRDLAARNILLGRDMIAMVSDFGLSRDVYQMGVYENTDGGILPMRWMSLESLENFTYTTESDVWSYGVVLWEIENEGQLPYAGISNGQQILEYLKRGNRLKNQENTSRDIQVMMQECWHPEPKQRPTFTSLVEKISEVYQIQGRQGWEERERRDFDDGYLSENQDLNPGQIAPQDSNTRYHDYEEIDGDACGGDTEVRSHDNEGYNDHIFVENNVPPNSAPNSSKGIVTITTSNTLSPYFA
ncbi:vascular endothelial growth factor receptor 1-like [Actinia tenebrosa]|uniref:receptor protein-tyrosine kinase n=1 Tax=Actinia tenebrosa TaxID=6105 RepID=A0A6P8HHI1_ACTTE|nr:vascular endothelial growth factor receptor 1-like [Actinia tenebrosa]